MDSQNYRKYGIIKTLSPEVFCVFFPKELYGIGYGKNLESVKLLQLHLYWHLKAHGCLGARNGVGAHFDITSQKGLEISVLPLDFSVE